jgi:glutaredoxin
MLRAMLRRILRRARAEVRERLPPPVLEAGRELRRRAASSLPPDLRDLGHRIEAAIAAFVAGEVHDAAPGDHAASDAHERVRSAADRDLERARARFKEEDAGLVVVYATDAERDDVSAIRRIFARLGEPVRLVDLTVDPRAFRNISTFTNVMVPPYVFIDGRHWGGRYEIEAIDAEGDLPAILSHRLDELGPVARTIGKLHESFSDAVTVENLRDRFARGHSLCIDGIDSWCERDGTATVLFHQGRRIAPEDVGAALEAIAADAAAGRITAAWRLEPAVKLD